MEKTEKIWNRRFILLFIKGAFKTLWVFLILTFPIVGGILYVFMVLQSSRGRINRKLVLSRSKALPLYSLPGDGYENAKASMDKHFQQVKYLQDYAKFPVYLNTETTYYPIGEAFHTELLAQLKQAQNYIFLEYFIIQQGKMWDPILNILKDKAAKGIKVRVLYDDLGCFFMLPSDYAKQLGQFGIVCAAFNPFRPVLTVEQNNRDHRKIAVMDGKVAFTGGINLADEYINTYEKHGHWKDTAIKLEGKAAWSFTLMFLEMWEVCRGIDEDFAMYYPWKDTPCTVKSSGFVQPYGDSPLDTDHVGEHVYLQILNEAADYVYINTPYLIADDSVVSALCLAAKRGVDVRIVTPHRWDKRLVHLTTRSYYRELIRAGVKVYEYGRGFIHAKSFVSDDRTSVLVGLLPSRSKFHRKINIMWRSSFLWLRRKKPPTGNNHNDKEPQREKTSVALFTGRGWPNLCDLLFKRPAPPQTCIFAELKRGDTLLSTLVITASNFLTIILAAILIQQGAFTIGNMVSFQIYIDKLTTAISSLLSMNFSAQTAGVAVDRIIEILSKEREPADEEFEPIKISKVQFSDVSFSYSNRPPILKQISFTIDKPGIYTFVGENGCGKTTILKLLMRYYDSSAGQILINDTPLEKMPIALLRRSVGYYSKDVYIENTTLLENLTLGTGVCLSGGVPAKVIEVCQRVGLDDFISRLSKGYDTIVGEDGKLLSSGQMQKIAVVRAILGDFSVLIFDEITSDLDGSAEKEIMSILSNFAKEKIIIHVTHRIQAVEGSTDIFLLEDGVIKIHGTHEALLQKSGEYKAMFQSKAT